MEVRRIIQSIRLLVFLCLCSGLLACSQSSQERAVVEDYLWRLSNVLDQPDEAVNAPLISYPEKRGMSLSFSQHSIDLLDFLAMTGCQLQITAAHKNSGLGRVMMSSQSFLYQWQFLEDSDACLAYLESNDPELYRTLARVVEIKRQELAGHAWLAVWAGPEMRNYFGATQQWLSYDQAILLPADDFQLLMKIQEIVRGIQMSPELVIPSVAPYRESLEQVLSRISQTNRGGEVLTTLLDLAGMLNQGTRILESGMNGRLCPQGQVTQKAKILHTVFLKFYIGQVQPYMAFVHQQGAEWMNQFHTLLNGLEVQTPEAFASFEYTLNQTSADGSWQRYQRSMKAHTKAWQGLLSECGLMPGN
ncbi:DUF3080 family protein [Litoribrevibacter albus]|uniref:DUF3080 family protein n=1 Tax=Litoribrevibacter albus TaxID=1473156 RepID=UPI0024E14CF3|nr:DUF3080 family protein [Litoribrevibacter albus]